MYDKDFLKSDDDLGYAMLPLAGLREAQDLDLDLPLSGKDNLGYAMLSVGTSGPP